MNYLNHPTKKDTPNRRARKSKRNEVYLKNRKLRKLLKREGKHNG